MTTRPLILLVAVVLAFASLRPLMRQDVVIPPKIPAAQAAPWMADCLPGVGPKRLPAALAAVRNGAWDQLPHQAHPEAWFVSP
jgi:hypothetical protein